MAGVGTGAVVGAGDGADVAPEVIALSCCVRAAT